LAALQAAARGANIRLVDLSVGRHEIDFLMASCDCYVSLHRSEGFGLTLAEAMAYGKPVIATAFGGNTDFMTATNSYLVDYDLVTTERRLGIYGAGWTRAEPDVAQAAACMRRVFEDREGARRIGEQARRDIERTLAPDVIGEMMKARLLAIAGTPGSETRTLVLQQP
jgi:glycosyltransferase involved in cell wall biosynthesis